MPKRSNVALDAGALLLAKATFIGLRLMLLYLAAASVDRATFGHLALAFTSAEICRYVGDWGTDTWSLRQFSMPDASSARGCFAWVVRLRLVGSSLSFVLAWVAIHLLAPQKHWTLDMLVAGTSVTSLWLNLGVNWLQARGLLRACAVWLAALGVTCGLALLFGHAHDESLASQVTTLITFEVIMTTVVLALAIRRPSVASVQAGIRLRDWSTAATPIALAALLALGYGRLDQYFVSRTASAEVLGDFMLAQRLVEPILFIAAALSSTLYARASALFHAQGLNPATRQTTWRWIQVIACTAGAAATVLAIVFSLGGPTALPQYASALPYVLVALACTVVRCTNLGLTAFVQALGAYGSMFRISLINAVTISISVLAAGTIFGPLGAALGVCAGEALNTGIQFLTLRKLLSTEKPE